MFVLGWVFAFVEPFGGLLKAFFLSVVISVVSLSEENRVEML